MKDRFVWNFFRKNWKSLLIFILLLLVVSLIVKNVGEIPYEDQYLMESTTPVQFTIQGNEMRGFVYLSYWVEGEPKKTEGMTTTELGNYLLENGQIDLRDFREPLVEVLQTYNAQEIRENWMDDYEFFKKRNVYFIENDEKLLDRFKELDVEINLRHQYKKMFFVYLNQEKYKEFIESLE